MYKVYGLSNPDKDRIRYIGVTKKSLEWRLEEHLYRLRKRKERGEDLTHKQNWLDSFVENYETDEVSIAVISEFEDEKKAYETEIKLIKESKNLTNIAEGGQRPPTNLKGEDHPCYGRSLSEETKRKIGEANSGENHGMYGMTGEDNPATREEVRKKISKSLQNSKAFQKARYSDEWKENMRKSGGMTVYLFDENGFVENFESCTAAAEWLDCTRGNVKNARRNERKIYKKYRVIAEKDLEENDGSDKR